MEKIEIKIYDKPNKRVLLFSGAKWHNEYDLLYIDGRLDVPCEDNLELLEMKVNDKVVWKK